MGVATFYNFANSWLIFKILFLFWFLEYIMAEWRVTSQKNISNYQLDVRPFEGSQKGVAIIVVL